MPAGFLPGLESGLAGPVWFLSAGSANDARGRPVRRQKRGKLAYCLPHPPAYRTGQCPTFAELLRVMNAAVLAWLVGPLPVSPISRTLQRTLWTRQVRG